MMLQRYQPQTTVDSVRALREIIQELALVGLWRAKFFEKAAFYGGTALRLLYGLDRFSEALDFSLLQPDAQFSLSKYSQAIQDELNAYGFDVTVDTKSKAISTRIESAFIKANTKLELINIGLQKFANAGIAGDTKVKIKLEVDTDPPGGFQTEAKTLLEPIPVSINVYVLSDLFAGKMHAVLCRMWKHRIKGRDWYDFVWFIRKKVPLNLGHLEQRMLQSGHLQPSERLTVSLFYSKLEEKIAALDIKNAIGDIRPFVADKAVLDCWSHAYFKEFAAKITIQD